MGHVSENSRVFPVGWRVLAALTLALLLLMLAFAVAPAAHAADSGARAVLQDSSTDHGCDDAATPSNDGCCDDDVAAAEGSPGDGCDDDGCNSASAATGGHDECPIECPAAPVDPAHGGGGDDNFACETEDAYARIVSLPVEAATGLPPVEVPLGAWQIGTVTYTVTSTTILEQRYGAFAIDKCVEVTWPITYPTFALKVETKPDFKCAGSDDDDHDNESELFGAIATLPDDPNLLGVWSVGEITFTVVPTTELKSSLNAFTVGTFIKAHLRTVDGQLVAREVKAIWAHDDDHDNGWGWWKWRKGRAFGPIETMPVSGTVGSWVIAGVAYTVTERTRLDERNGELVVGANVKVEFWKTRDGDRIAHKIKTTDDTGNGDGQFRFVGVVDAKPEAFVGDWTIGGAAFVADTNTVFDESRGLLVVDAYVSVRYVITDNMRIASEIKTVVPPGGGGHHHFGWIERQGSSTSTGVMAADGAAANSWRIGGVEYVVTPATLLNDDISELVEGQLAIVNAYAEADGTLVATSIEGITQTMQQFLPMLSSK